MPALSTTRLLVVVGLLNSKQRTGVVAEDLLPDIGGEALLFDDLLRMRPSARGVRVVGAEHDLVYVENAAHHLDADRVVNETDPDLPVKVFAREQLGRVIGLSPVSLRPSLVRWYQMSRP